MIVGLNFVWLENNNGPTKSGLFIILVKSVRPLKFSGKTLFSANVNFHSEIFGAAVFKLVLGYCMVKAVIFIKNVL